MQRQTGFFLAIFVALGALAVWTVQRPAERGMQRLRLASVATDTVDHIDVTGAHQATLQREGTSWRLKSGRAADARAVQQVLDEVRNLESTELVTEDASRFADLGVEGQKATHVAMTANGKNIVTLVLSEPEGGMGSPGAPAYVRKGDTVWSVPSFFGMSLRREESAWLDRHLFDFEEAQVQELTVATHAKKPYTLHRGEEGWQLDANGLKLSKHFRFDPGAGGSLVNVLFGSQASEWLETDPGEAQTGLTEAEADRIAWRYTDKKPEAAAEATGEAAVAQGASHEGALLIGKAKDDSSVYAKLKGGARDGMVFTMAKSQADGIRRAPNDLRSLNVMAPLDFDTVVAARIEKADHKTLSMIKDDDTWKLRGKAPTPGFVLDPIKVPQRLRKALMSRAIGVAEPSEGRLTPSSGRIVLVTKDKREHLLQFGPTVGKGSSVNAYWARGTIDGALYHISKPLYDELVNDWTALSRTTPPAAGAAKAPTGQGLESLPPDVRRNIEQQLATGGQK